MKDKLNNKNYIVIGAMVLIFSIVFLVVIGGKITYSASYSKEYLQKMVVSTALSYYYNQNNTDYEQYSMDDKQDSPYNIKTYHWRNFNISPEELSRSNLLTIDCSGFVSIVYLHSLGYDFSDYRSADTRIFYHNREMVNANSSLDNYQTSYLNYGFGPSTAFFTSIANSYFNNGSSVGVEYINSDNDSIFVYYYKVDLDSNGNYNETSSKQEQIKSYILANLQPGDILVYRVKKSDNTSNGHAILYVGDELNSADNGFIHSTGVDIDYTTTPINLGKDTYSVRYDTWNDMFKNKIFVDSDDSYSLSFTILRPINNYCTGDVCNINSSNIKSNMFKSNLEDNLNNSIAREELSRLGIEQYETQRAYFDSTEGNGRANGYNSVNKGDDVTYTLTLTNKSVFSYCQMGNPGYNTKEKCENAGYTWKTTTGSAITYSGIKITGKIPTGTTFVSCTNNCVQEGSTVTWNNVSIASSKSSSYSYVVKVNTNNVVTNNGMVITTSGGRQLQLGELTTVVNPTINASEEIDVLKSNINKFKELVDNNKINFVSSSSGDYKKNLNNLTSANMTKLDFVRSIYYNAYGIDLGNLTFESVRDGLFNTDSGIFTRKNASEVSSLTGNYAKMNSMLVPGVYGGRKLKGNDGLDRLRYFVASYLEIGDILLLYDVDNNVNKVYVFYGLDASGNSMFVGYNDGQISFHNSSTAVTGLRIVREMYSYDLFAVLRPTRLYGGVVYDANGGSGAPSSQTKTHGTNLTLSTTEPTKNNYTFVGWSTSSSATTSSYNAGGTYNGDKVVTKLYAVWSKNVSPINITDYTLKGEFILGISPRTNVSGFDLGIDNSYTVKILDKNNDIKTSGYIGTGDKIQIYLNNEMVDEYIVVIKGDITGDGSIAINDVAKLYRGLKSKVTLTNYEIEAGNIIEDDIIKINDVSKLYRYIKGKIDTL